MHTSGPFPHAYLKDSVSPIVNYTLTSNRSQEHSFRRWFESVMHPPPPHTHTHPAPTYPFLHLDKIHMRTPPLSLSPGENEVHMCTQPTPPSPPRQVKSGQCISQTLLGKQRKNKRKEKSTKPCSKKKLQYHNKTKIVYTNLDSITHSPFHSRHTHHFITFRF